MAHSFQPPFFPSGSEQLVAPHWHRCYGDRAGRADRQFPDAPHGGVPNLRGEALLGGRMWEGFDVNSIGPSKGSIYSPLAVKECP